MQKKIQTFLFGVGFAFASPFVHATLFLESDEAFQKVKDHTCAYYEHSEGMIRGYLPQCVLGGFEDCPYLKTVSVKGSRDIDEISFIYHPTDEHRFFVRRHYKNVKSYEAELENLERVQNTTKIYFELENEFLQQQKEEIKVLGLAEIYGMARDDAYNVRAMYMKGVSGNTLRNLAKNAHDLNEQKIRSIFYQCGLQLGNTYVMLSSPEANRTLSSYYPEKSLEKGRWHFVHPDTNWGNFLYDEDKERLYAIDLTGNCGIEFRKKEDEQSFSQHVGLYLLFYTRDMLREAHAACTLAKAKLETDFSEASLNAKKALHIIYGHQAMFQGFKQSVDKVRAPLTIDFVFKSLFGWQKPYAKISPFYERCGYNYTMFESLLQEIEDVALKLLGRKVHLKAEYAIRRMTERAMVTRD
ncbi:MAG: hypothetical protein ACK5TR_00015 [Alphaproteobacteria bacterium]|jgi:hypothetical protein|nr:hypothetical protein [Alphaproteobacteria bacterium]